MDTVARPRGEWVIISGSSRRQRSRPRVPGAAAPPSSPTPSTSQSASPTAAQRETPTKLGVRLWTGCSFQMSATRLTSRISPTTGVETLALPAAREPPRVPGSAAFPDEASIAASHSWPAEASDMLDHAAAVIFFWSARFCFRPMQGGPILRTDAADSRARTLLPSGTD